MYLTIAAITLLFLIDRQTAYLAQICQIMLNSPTSQNTISKKEASIITSFSCQKLRPSVLL